MKFADLPTRKLVNAQNFGARDMRCGYLWEGVVTLLVWVLLGWSEECALNVCVEGVVCAEVLTGGGLGLRHSPEGGGLASLHSAFPTPLPRGPWHNNRKKLKGRLVAPFVFLHPSLAYKSKLLTLGTGTKKALKRCLRAFSVVVR